METGKQPQSDINRSGRQTRNLPSLNQPATYQIKVPGKIDVSWASGLEVAFECECNNPPVTTLTGTLDQAALHGLLFRLYSLGLPLISVICVD